MLLCFAFRIKENSLSELFIVIYSFLVAKKSLLASPKLSVPLEISAITPGKCNIRNI